MPLPPNTNAASSQPQLIVPMSLEEEDAIIHARHQNDDKSLRRVIKKFHTFTRLSSASGAITNTPEDKSTENDPTEEARAAFLLELSSYELALRRTTLVCEAEARQVAEYESEKRRIAHEHENLLGQISQLKTSLEHAQVDRRRKIEYDVLAEKINALPTRDELSLTIEALESDMEAIQLEQDTQQSTLRAQKDALRAVLDSISALRRIGKEEEGGDGDNGGGEGGDDAERGATEEGEEREARASPVLVLNPAAKPFVPPTVAGRLQASDAPSRTSTPLNGRGTPLPGSRSGAKEDDIEMGEVSEVKRKRKPEELEEGEASDSSRESGEAADDS